MRSSQCILHTEAPMDTPWAGTERGCLATYRVHGRQGTVIHNVWVWQLCPPWNDTIHGKSTQTLFAEQGKKRCCTTIQVLPSTFLSYSSCSLLLCIAHRLWRVSSSFTTLSHIRFSVSVVCFRTTAFCVLFVRPLFIATLHFALTCIDRWLAPLNRLIVPGRTEFSLSAEKCENGLYSRLSPNYYLRFLISWPSMHPTSFSPEFPLQQQQHGIQQPRARNQPQGQVSRK